MKEKAALFELFGTPLTVRQLSELSGFAPDTIRYRLKRGLTAAEAVATSGHTWFRRGGKAA